MNISENSDKTSLVLSSCIGINTRIWQFCVILENAVIGDNCNICSHVFIENNVTIGHNVTIKNASLIYDGVVIEDNVFIGPRVVFANDKYPRSKMHLDKFSYTTIQRNASIGAGAIILPGITVAQNSLIGAGSVVTKDVAANTIVAGNPAKYIRAVT
jgi:UDP-2-acetamido-3-amino-2,3-dideoxy-glucuronate N-acetyltransferase